VIHAADNRRCQPQMLHMLRVNTKHSRAIQKC
jgi:hypothetical protein